MAVESEMITAAGWPLSPTEVASHFLGKTDTHMVSEIERHLGTALPGEWLQHLHARYGERFETDLRPVEGVVAALDTIEATGISTCVASSGVPRNPEDPYLDWLMGPFRRAGRSPAPSTSNMASRHRTCSSMQPAPWASHLATPRWSKTAPRNRGRALRRDASPRLSNRAGCARSARRPEHLHLRRHVDVACPLEQVTRRPTPLTGIIAAHDRHQLGVVGAEQSNLREGATWEISARPSTRISGMPCSNTLSAPPGCAVSKRHASTAFDASSDMTQSLWTRDDGRRQART